jgi:hypothetical protein
VSMGIAIMSMSALVSIDVSYSDEHKIEGISINNECCAIIPVLQLVNMSDVAFVA